MNFKFWERKHKNNPLQSIEQLESLIPCDPQNLNSDNIKSLQQILVSCVGSGDIDCNEVLALFKGITINKENVMLLGEFHEKFADLFYDLIINKKTNSPDIAKYVSAFIFHKNVWFELIDNLKFLCFSGGLFCLELANIRAKTGITEAVLTDAQKQYIEYIKDWERNKDDEICGFDYSCFDEETLIAKFS